MLTLGNTDDCTPIPKLLQQLFGKIFADKGYIPQKLTKHLLKTTGIQLIPKLKRTMETAIVTSMRSSDAPQALDDRNMEPIGIDHR